MFVIAYFIGIFLVGFITPLIPSGIPFANWIVMLLPPTVIWFILKKFFKKKAV